MLVVPSLAERFGGGSWSCGPSMSKQTRFHHKAGNGIQWYIIKVIALLYSFKRAIRRSSSKTITSISGMRCFGPWVPLCFRGVCQASNELPCEASNIDKGGAPGPAVTLFPFSVVCCHGFPVLTASYVVTLDYSCITT